MTLVKSICTLKQIGRMEINEGKRHLKWDGYSLLAEKFMKMTPFGNLLTLLETVLNTVSKINAIKTYILPKKTPREIPTTNFLLSSSLMSLPNDEKKNTNSNPSSPYTVRILPSQTVPFSLFQYHYVAILHCTFYF